MFDRLLVVAEELSLLLDEIESSARNGAYNETGVVRRQWQSTYERARIAREGISDELSQLARELRAAESYRVR